MSTRGLVLDIDRFSTHDGPGIRTAVFVKGCPLKCKWCHSPESQSGDQELLYQRMRCTGCYSCAAACPQGAISTDGEVIEKIAGVAVHRDRCVKCYTCVKACNFRAMRRGGTEYLSSALIDSVKPDINFYKNSSGGVTVTGGEPLMQAKFTYEFLAGCRELGIHTMIETCGQGSGVELKQIADVCAGIYFDVKLMDSEKHLEWTGVPNKIILDNLRLLCMSPETAAKIIVRLPCIPGVNDDPENIKKTAEFVHSIGIPSMQLMPYNAMAGEKYRWIGKDYELAGKETREKSYYEGLNRIIESVGIKAVG
ncbi:glycyl-radical enzyme activating protein [Spirochaetia bacterium]|nr:glycyl-radical enzyme activating protein [Spirochaetia bacterium]